MTDPSQADHFVLQRHRLLKELRRYGVRDRRVLLAMEEVPREAFIPANLAHMAYENAPLPIGEGQTISQPLIVALMIEALLPQPSDRVLEIGTGSGYSAAVLSRLVREVYSIERHASLAESAERVLGRLGYDNIQVRQGDGTQGWPEKAPFDSIVVTAGAPDVPQHLVEQLAIGGRLVIPVGKSRESQHLVRVVRSDPDRYQSEDLGAVRFVPLIGAHGWDDSPDD